MGYDRWRTLAAGVMFALLVCGCAGTARRGNVWVPVPGAWDEAATRMRAGKPGHESAPSTQSLEYHSRCPMGLCLTHVKFTIDSAVLKQILSDVIDADAYFSSDYDISHAFGPNSNKIWDPEADSAQRLPWWRPWDEVEPVYYRWFMHEPGKSPKTYVWLQVSDGKRDQKLVYMRVEIQ
tara:strand:+ start:873 stop:1409 length:537 start_codon:yes stop_codon:yes gene_type:complete